MIKKITGFIFIFLCLFANTAKAEDVGERYFDVTLRGEDRNLKIINVDVVGTRSSLELSGGDYVLEEVSFKGEVRNKKSFRPGLYSTHLQIPYDGEVEKLVVKSKDGLILAEKKIGYFAQVCGDGTCQAHESYEICPKDCRSGRPDGYCDGLADGACDPDCQSGDVDCLLNSSTKYMGNRGVFWAIAIGCSVVLAGGAWIFYKRRKASV